MVAISFLMTVTEPKDAVGCTLDEVVKGRAGAACKERMARVLVL